MHKRKASRRCSVGTVEGISDANVDASTEEFAALTHPSLLLGVDSMNSLAFHVCAQNAKRTTRNTNLLFFFFFFSSASV